MEPAPPAYSAPAQHNSNVIQSNVSLTAEQIEARERAQAERDSDTDTDSDEEDNRIPLEQRRSIVGENTELPAGWIREWDPTSVVIPRTVSYRVQVQTTDYDMRG